MACSSNTLVRIVSVNGSPRRRTFLLPDETLGLAWSFFDALEEKSPQLRYSDSEAIAFSGRTLTKGEIGCYSSHYELWTEVASLPKETKAFIFEDDVIVDWSYIKFLSGIDWTVRGVDYLRLFAKIPSKFRVVKRGYPDRYRTLIEYLDYSLGTQAYMITPPAAIVLSKQCAIIKRPVDREIDRSWFHGIRNISIFPSPVVELNVSSSIGAVRFERPNTRFRSRLRFLVERAADKARRLRFRLFAKRPQLNV